MFRRVANALPAWGWALLLVTLPPFIRGIMGLMQMPLAPGDLIGVADPDPWLRLLLVKQWLQGASWYDHSYMSNAPHFAVSPWTRPLDTVIAFFTKLQPGDAPLSIKLIRTALFLPVLWMGLMMLGLLACVRSITPAPAASMMLAVLLLTAPVIHNYFGAGNADHHALLAALWAWALYFLLGAREGGWRMPIGAGLLLTLMLWISPEAQLLLLGSYVWLGLCWLLGRFTAKPLARLASIIALAATAALMIERPIAQWFTPIYDSLSIVHVMLLALCALAAWALTFGPPVRPYLRATIAGALLGGIAAIMHNLYPLFFHGPMALVDPFIFSDFLPQIREAQPLGSEHPIYILAMLIQPLVAIGIAWLNSIRQDGVIPIATAAALAFMLCLTLGMYAAEMRWYYYLYPVIAITLAPWLAAWWTPNDATLAYFWPAYRVRALNESEQVFRRLPLLVIVLALPLALLFVRPDEATKHSKQIDRCQEDARRVIMSGELDRLGDGVSLTLFAPTDLGAQILFFTRHRIVASNYHREGKGLHDIWKGEKTVSDAALSTLFARRGINAMLICPRAGQPKRSVVRRLYEGTLTLPWLEPVPLTTPKLSKSRPVIFLVKAPAAQHTSEKQ